MDDNKERKRLMFVDMVEEFFKKWKPQDRYDESRFSAEFFGLVRQIHLDANEQYRKEMTDLAMYASHPLAIRRTAAMPPNGHAS